MYKLRIPIRDWSNDGHGKCNYHTISSNMTIEKVREVHFKIKEKTGVDIESICSEYDDSYINLEMIDKLAKIGLSIEELDLLAEGEVCMNAKEDEIYVSNKDMCHIWIALLNYVDPNLNLTLLKNIPMLSFYEFDKYDRHIGQVGYGCFD